MKGTFIGKNDSPVEKLGRIGPGLARTIKLHEEAKTKLRLLWRIYLADCLAHSVGPVESPWTLEEKGKKEPTDG